MPGLLSSLLPMYFIDDLLASRARKDDEQPGFLACTHGAALDQYEYFTVVKLDQLTNNATHILMRQGLSRKAADAVSVPVAVLDTSNLEYLDNIYALSRLGYSVRIPSP